MEYWPNFWAIFSSLFLLILTRSPKEYKKKSLVVVSSTKALHAVALLVYENNFFHFSSSDLKHCCLLEFKIFAEVQEYSKSNTALALCSQKHCLFTLSKVRLAYTNIYFGKFYLRSP